MDNTSKQTDNIANKSMSFPEHTYYFTYITLFITGILLWVSSVKDAFSIWPFFASTILYSFILCWDIYYKYEWFDLSWYMSFIIFALIIGCLFNTVSSALVGYTMENLRGTFAKSKQKIVFDAKTLRQLLRFKSFGLLLRY